MAQGLVHVVAIRLVACRRATVVFVVWGGWLSGSLAVCQARQQSRSRTQTCGAEERLSLSISCQHRDSMVRDSFFEATKIKNISPQIMKKYEEDASNSRKCKINDRFHFLYQSLRGLEKVRIYNKPQRRERQPACTAVRQLVAE